MILLIDANIILDYFLVRRVHFNNAQQLMIKCREPSIKGYVSFHSLPIIWYTLRRYSIQERRRALLEVTDLLQVVSVSHETVINAVKNEAFADFEDCLQEKCALEVGADYIVTRNIKDFTASEIPAITPAEMIEILCN